MTKQQISTQIYKLEQQLNKLEKERQKERDMIDIMGHELRTPMSIIKLNLDLLCNSSTKNNKNSAKYLARIKDAVETEIKLINTLLSSAKLEGDKIELNYEKVNLLQQIEMALHTHEAKAKHKKLQLITKLSPNSTYIYADHARVVEILNNLIDNAIKYTHQGNVTIKTEEKNDFIQISITDTGRGMSKENVSALGTKFFRVGNYTESKNCEDFNIVKPEGTGLGLYVTFNLIEKMGGKIHVDSKLGEGTTFTFTLPKYTGQTIEKRTDTKDKFTKLKLKEK
ncbi:HAMP domain-containing histidine kinase [bacterium]|nr:HAMP domain-containing histidine kinase [bacterium]